MTRKVFLWLASVIISLSAGLIGSIFTLQAIPTWYASLHKPFFTPPNWLFGPVWTVLYILMGTAYHIIFPTYTTTYH